MRNIYEYYREKEEEIESLTEELKNIEDSMYESLDSVKSEFKKHIRDGNMAYSVARKITTDELNRMDSLKLIHTALFKLNESFVSLSVNEMDNVNFLYLKAKSLYDSYKTRIQNDEIFNKLTTSNAERSQKVNFLMLEPTNVMKNIDLLYKSFKNIVSLMDNQISYLNKLDSMIRLQQKIIDSGAIGEIIASGNSVIRETI